MESVRTNLRQVWEILHRAKIQDDLTIIEYIAWLLTKDHRWTIDPKARPQRPPYGYNLDHAQLLALLGDAAEQLDKANPTQGMSQLFNNHILFYASPTRQRDSYPTPRHIIDFMLSLIDVRPEHDFADFACGSGGFLIRLLPPLSPIMGTRQTHLLIKENAATLGKRVGVDISPNWVHIVNANMMLHAGNDSSAQIVEGDALRLYGPGGKFANENFDRIAMSPPLEQTVGDERQFSDEAFTNLLLEKLKENGRGITLVGNYLLDRATYTQRLSQHLDAVIALVNALQPFVQEPVNALLVNKKRQVANKFIWFLHIEEDGYAAKRNRDLTEKPSSLPVKNDLLFARKITRITGREQEFAKGKPVSYKKIMERGKLLGVVIKASKDYRVFIYLSENDKRIALAINHIPFNSLLDISGTQEIKLQEYNRSGMLFALNDISNKIIIEDNRHYERLIAITSDGRLLGIREPASQLHLTQYSLLPSTYLDQLKPTYDSYNLPLPWPSEQETTIQHEVSLSLPEVAPIRASQELFSPASIPLHPPLEIPPHLLAALNPRQREVWEAILALESNRPYFTLEQFSGELEHNTLASTINLLTRLGLIVPVTLKNEKTGRTLQCYRRTFQSELDTTGQSTETVK